MLRVLSAGGAQRLHPEEALRNIALRHAEQRAHALSLVAMSTTFRLPLNGLATVARALIRAKPQLSCHASTSPATTAKQAPQRPGA
jgi:hypothetical protein